jgi:TPR repeat protein
MRAPLARNCTHGKIFLSEVPSVVFSGWCGLFKAGALKMKNLVVALVLILSSIANAKDLARSADQAANDGDFYTALRLYRQLANKGNARAQYKVGVMIQDGNLKEAVKWLKSSAEKGYAAAQFTLGSMYENGRGVRQDQKEAQRLYHLAAAQGLEAAERKLGTKESEPSVSPQAK